MTTMTMEELKGNVKDYIERFGYEKDCEEVNYETTDYGIDSIVDTWKANKANIHEILSKHPCYNGRYQIVLDDTSYDREIDEERAAEFYYKYFDDRKWDMYFCCTKEIPSHVADNWNAVFADIDLRAREGQRTSRVVRKICKKLGIDKEPDFERDYAKFADALNPLKVTRYTVISWNPVDYLGMSYGNSWSSCHTIDKCGWEVETESSYEGMYSNGTMSYMLDGSSVVVYTISKDYKGNTWELEPKITRNMFHYEDGLLVQGRMYPQTSDGNGDMYKITREIVQRVFADCLDVPNLWYCRKGTGVCDDYTYSIGTHYRDYTYFDDCNVSFLGSKKEYDEGKYSRKYVRIGHNPICPKCGREHNDYANNIMCEECIGLVHCERCGCVIREDDAIRDVDTGNVYCDSDCAGWDDVFYCEDDWEYHSEWNRDYYTGEYYSTATEGIRPVNATEMWFSSLDTAIDYGCVVATDGELYDPEGWNVHYCEECGEWIPEDDWNEEKEMCNDCVENCEESEGDVA